MFVAINETLFDLTLLIGLFILKWHIEFFSHILSDISVLLQILSRHMIRLNIHTLMTTIYFLSFKVTAEVLEFIAAFIGLGLLQRTSYRQAKQQITVHFSIIFRVVKI